MTSDNVPATDSHFIADFIADAVASLVDGLALVDAEGRVAFWNARAQALFRLSATDAVGLRLDELIDRIAARTSAPNTAREHLQAALKSCSDAALQQAALAQAARKPDAALQQAALEQQAAHKQQAAHQQAAVEVELRPEPGQEDSDRPTQIISLRCFVVRDSNQNRIGTGILMRDITRERTADAMKSQLLSTVSHELRTPLASIKGFATTLLRQDVKWDTATQRDFLRIIEEESDRLTEIIDNLLDMSQIEAGALRIAKEPTQLRQLVREVVDEMRMRTEVHYFVVDLQAELPRVMIDPRRIRQVLTNLIGNAIKYSKKGQITVGCEMGDGQLTVSVSDQGEGIPPELRDKIFERFFQADNTSTRRVGGSGLGLSISRGIVQAHDGKIWVESETGQGSTFRFTLPLTETSMIE